MENASRALMMAGGVLIALMIIGALLLMFNQISAYQKNNSDSQRDVQISNFNMDFARYSDSKNIKGVDIITLINKIIDYNTRANKAENNYVDYNIKMSIEVDKLKVFKTKYAVDGASLFPDKLIVGVGNNNFANAIATYSKYESIYTLPGMSRLASSYNRIKNSGYREGSKDYKNLIKEITGKNSENNIPSLQEIKEYSQYSEFKSSTFRTSKDPDYENGQIKTLYFEFVN